MSPPKAKSEITWPDLDSSYVDEFGFIDVTVYAVARRVWPVVAPSVLRTLRDLPAGQRIMMKAVALVSRKLVEDPGRISNVHGYLYRTFVRSLKEEAEKEGKHAELNLALLVKNESNQRPSDEGIIETIMVHQLLERADPTTRSIFELLLLGHRLEEIAKAQGIASNRLRNYWSRKIRRLIAEVESEMREAELKLKTSRVGGDSSFDRRG